MVTKFEGTAPGGWRRRIVEMISDPLRGGANWLIPGERFDIPSSLPVNRISKELTGYNSHQLLHHLTMLKDSGLIERIGKTRYYKFSTAWI